MLCGPLRVCGKQKACPRVRVEACEDGWTSGIRTILDGRWAGEDWEGVLG